MVHMYMGRVIASRAVAWVGGGEQREEEGGDDDGLLVDVPP